MADPPRPTDPPESIPPAGPDDLLDESQPFEPGQRAMHGLLTILFEQADQDSARRAAGILDRVARERAAVAAAAEEAAGPGAGAPSFAQRRVGDGRRQWGGRRPARPVCAAAGLLAAACIALLVIPWSGPVPAFDAEVGAFVEWAYMTSSPVRGQGEEAEARRSGQQTRRVPPAWVEAVLDEPGVRDALATHDWTQGTILIALSRGGLRLDRAGQPVLADGIDQASPAGGPVLELIERDRAACETIVQGLVRHVPGAKPEDRARLAEALNRYRAEHVFGGG